MRLWMKALGFVALSSVAVTFAGAQPPTGKPGSAPTDKTSQPGNAPRFDVARFMKDHDKNNDGKLSKDELPSQAQDQFNQIDTNKDGFITQDELQAYANKMAHQRPQLVEVIFYAIDVPEEPLNLQELQAAYDQLRKLDKNHDGKIDEGELKAFRDQRRKERVDGIFHSLDKNNDGKISKDEARGFWSDDFTQLDTNKDGFLDRSEIEAALSKRSDGHHGPGGTGTKPGQPDK